MPDPAPAEEVLAAVRAPFRALAATILPRCSDLDQPGWRSLETLVGRALLDRPPALRRQLRLLVRVLWWLPLLGYGRVFGSLDAEEKRRFLGRIERSRLPLLRRGFWGLRTLVLMGWYGRPEGGASTGWSPRLRGWEEKGPRPTAPAPDVPPAADPEVGRGEEPTS